MKPESQAPWEIRLSYSGKGEITAVSSDRLGVCQQFEGNRRNGVQYEQHNLRNCCIWQLSKVSVHFFFLKYVCTGYVRVCTCVLPCMNMLRGCRLPSSMTLILETRSFREPYHFSQAGCQAGVWAPSVSTLTSSCFYRKCPDPQSHTPFPKRGNLTL